MSRTRDYRRSQVAKRKLRVRRYRRWWWSEDPADRSWVTARMVGMAANTPKSCSCYMCGNPRKWWLERTRQEIRSDIDKLEFAQMTQLVEVPGSNSGS